MLAALGLQNLPSILLLTPVEAMLLAAFASWHPHDGRSDWLVPPLLQAAEYVFIAEVGFAGQVWPPLTFALVAAVGLRHLDLAYRVRSGLAAGHATGGAPWLGGPHARRRHRRRGWHRAVRLPRAGAVPVVVAGRDWASAGRFGGSHESSSAVHAAVDC